MTIICRRPERRRRSRAIRALTSFGEMLTYGDSETVLLKLLFFLYIIPVACLIGVFLWIDAFRMLAAR